MSIHGQQFGDYIHYNYNNYLRYGVAKKTDNAERIQPPNTASFQEMLATHHGKILNITKQKASRKYCKDLENLLNFFSGAKGSKASSIVDLPDNWVQKLQYILINIMEESYDIAENGINFEKGTVNLKSSLRNKVATLDQNGKKQYFALANMARSHAGHSTSKATKNKETAFNVKNLQMRADTVLHYAQSYLQSGKTTGRLGGNLVQLVSNLSNVKKSFEKEMSGMNFISPGTENWKKANDFQTMIKELAKECLFRMAVSLCEGQLEEYIVAAISGVLENKINLCEADLIKDFIINRASTAMNRNSNVILQSSITADLKDLFNTQVMKGTSYKFSGTKDNIGWYTTATQDKVDVGLSVGGASIKSYNLEGDYSTKVGISLVSQTNLLTILLQSPVFANHYLNITGINETHGSSNLLYAANNALKELVFITAISGSLNKDTNNFADYFIIRDKASGKHSVYLISDLLERISRNLDLVTVKMKDGFLERNTTWANDWVGYSNHCDPSMKSAMIRIARLSKQLQTNVNVHLNIKALK